VAQIAGIEAYWAPDLLLATSMKHDGAWTRPQLQQLFRSCTTPGGQIHVGVLGGSISLDNTPYWPRVLRGQLADLCRNTTVVLYNGARASTGSLGLGACASTSMGAIPRDRGLDLFVSEFTLNDG
jgi:hypothetical protein